MLFYIEYGCSISRDRSIVDADSFEKANQYAEQSAQDVYYSYDCNYPNDEDYMLYEEEGLTEDEISENEYMDMLNDIEWTTEVFNEKDEEHISTLHEQNGISYKI